MDEKNMIFRWKQRKQLILGLAAVLHVEKNLVAAAHFFTKLPDSWLFWAAYVLTRPLGATLGDTLTKSHPEGGLALGRVDSSLVIAGAMIVLIAVTYHWEGIQAALWSKD